jgi:hypothetical protein
MPNVIAGLLLILENEIPRDCHCPQSQDERYGAQIQVSGLLLF